MVARLLRWNLLCLAAMAGLLATWAGTRGELPAWAVAAAFAGAFLGASLATTLTTFLIAWLTGSPVPAGLRMGPVAAIGYALREWLAFIVLFHLVQPFERLWLGKDRLRPLPPGEMPLLLIHGYGCNRGTWWRLRRRLEEAGHCVATVNLEPPFGTIADYVPVLRQRIEDVLAATGASRVILIGHSMGGLAARAYLARHGPGRAHALLSLGTPHNGSALAKLGLGRNAREMEPGSAFLLGLPVPRELPGGVTAFFSLHDNYVMPQASQALAGADNRPLRCIGHLAMVHSPRVAERIVRRLTEIRGAAATA